jgi:hypothetical protein
MQNENEVSNEVKVCIAKRELNEECSAEPRSEPRVVPSPEWLVKHGVRMQTRMVRQSEDKVAKPEKSETEKSLKGGDSSVSHKVGMQSIGEGWDWG